MKILVVGASGTLGKAVVAALSPRHHVIEASRSSRDFSVDISDPESIAALFRKVGKIDALVCAAGKVHWGPLTEMRPEHWEKGLRDKLMGQVNLTLQGLSVLNDGGSITLIGGILSREPIRRGAQASLVSGALDAFVKAAAIELPRGIRINLVSPTIFVESMQEYDGYFPGFKPVPVSEAALGYVKSIEGAQTGQIYAM